jgi:hypothetical protein
MKYEWSSPSITWHQRLHSYLLNVISEGNYGEILGTELGDREVNIKMSRANVVNNRHKKGPFGIPSDVGNFQISVRDLAFHRGKYKY